MAEAIEAASMAGAGTKGAALGAALAGRGLGARLLAPSPARLLLASCALAVAMAGYAAVGPGGALDTAAAQADEAAEAVRADHAALRRRVRALAAPPQAAPEAPDPTRFVQAAYEAAARSGVRIVRLAPHQREDAMEVQLAASYGAFVRFAAELELLGATLRLPQIQGAGAPAGSGAGANSTANAGANAGDDGPQLAVSLMADLPRHAAVAGTHGDATRQAASSPSLRNPFAPVGSGGIRDLSAQYKLSGTTAGGAAPMATIDGLDYEPGEVLDGMQVVRVTDEAVHLARGEDRFVIRLPGLPAGVPAGAPAGPDASPSAQRALPGAIRRTRP